MNVINNIKIFDTHSHIIYGVDDGALNLKESIKMIDISYEQGVRSIILTPHSSAFIYNGLKNIIKKYRIIKNNIKDKYNDLDLYLGSEIFCYKRNINNVLNELNYNIIPSINDTKYILVEFSNNFNINNEILYCLNFLCKNGWYPILAHAERYDVDNLTYHKIHNIAKIQINLYSIYKENDLNIRERVNYLLENNLIDIIGSDAHRMNHRPPDIIDGATELIKKCGVKKANKILYENAKSIFCS